MTQPLRHDLLLAFIASRLSVRELRERAGITCERSSLQRKLRGQSPLRLEEAEAIAAALGLRIVLRRPKAA